MYFSWFSWIYFNPDLQHKPSYFETCKRFKYEASAIQGMLVPQHPRGHFDYIKNAFKIYFDIIGKT